MILVSATNGSNIKINFDTMCTLSHPSLFTLSNPRVFGNPPPMSVAVCLPPGTYDEARAQVVCEAGVLVCTLRTTRYS